MYEDGQLRCPHLQTGRNRRLKPPFLMLIGLGQRVNEADQRSNTLIGFSLDVGAGPPKSVERAGWKLNTEQLSPVFDGLMIGGGRCRVCLYAVQHRFRVVDSGGKTLTPLKLGVPGQSAASLPRCRTRPDHCLIEPDRHGLPLEQSRVRVIRRATGRCVSWRLNSVIMMLVSPSTYLSESHGLGGAI